MPTGVDTVKYASYFVSRTGCLAVIAIDAEVAGPGFCRQGQVVFLSRHSGS